MKTTEIIQKEIKENLPNGIELTDYELAYISTQVHNSLMYDLQKKLKDNLSLCFTKPRTTV
jgi:hypothetical protein